ncbi:MAG: arsenate reductase ArsC [Flavobacteriales bacterium]|jgi:arsenate reductase|nr:arsenate reductase ArsC [Flavobacteriales bacterium]
MKRVLILCTGNSCRSQMAEGYLRHFAGRRAEVRSGGVEAHGLNPRAVAVMAEDGVDISGGTSDLVDAWQHVPFDHVITVCDSARERCPWFPSNAQHWHHDFPDPAKTTGDEAEIMAEFRRVRDLIKAYCAEFAKAQL